MPGPNENLFTVRLPPEMIQAIKTSGRDRTELAIAALNAELGTNFQSRPRGGQLKPPAPAKRKARKRA